MWPTSKDFWKLLRWQSWLSDIAGSVVCNLWEILKMSLSILSNSIHSGSFCGFLSIPWISLITAISLPLTNLKMTAVMILSASQIKYACLSVLESYSHYLPNACDQSPCLAWRHIPNFGHLCNHCSPIFFQSSEGNKTWSLTLNYQSSIILFGH